jgi:hypothetical protein
MVIATYKQTFIGIWFHDNIFLPDLQDKMKLHLNRTFHYYRIFANEGDFYTYIGEERLITKIFLIISASDPSLDYLINLTEQYSKIFEKVYIFLPTKNYRSTCFTTNNMKDLFEEVNKDIQTYIDTTFSGGRLKFLAGLLVKFFFAIWLFMKSTVYFWVGAAHPAHLVDKSLDGSLPSLSVFNSETKRNTPIRHMTKESLHFLCFLRMTNILRRICYTPEELLEMWTCYRDIYKENQPQLDHIDELARTYNGSEAIRYYTGNSCLSRTVNQACHTENMKEIFTFRVYISDLHKQLVQCDKQDEKNELKSLIRMVYRGKPLSGSVLQQLIDNVGGLISMNGFLSTTVVDKVASHYHGDDQVANVRVGYRPVLFVFTINTTIKQPYAFIGNCSTKPDESEVLFSLGTIWRIKSVTIDKDPCLVELTSYDESDLQSIEILKKNTEEGCDLLSIGDILLKLGDDDQAEWFYGKMLKQASLDVETKGTLYHKIGMIRFEKNDYSVALEKLKKAADLLPSSINKLGEIIPSRPRYLCDEQSPFITMFTNMGIMYEKDGQFEEAINCYKQAVKIKNESNLGLAIAHNHLGLLYFRLGKYKEAWEHHEKATKLADEGDPNWIEFQRNLKIANERYEHRMSYVAQ